MPSSITRSSQTDAAWREEMLKFVRAAQKIKRPLLIDYLFDPPDHIVPQRLYRYDVFEDYVSRHRDDFEFGFDLIIHAEYITAQRTYGVYVIELEHNSNHVYVGQTWYMPHERLAQHNTGFAAFHAARPFKHGLRGTLRPDLYGHLSRFRSQRQAEAMEEALALQLRKLGFRVEGGH
jgi:hypothetical protein